MTDRISTVVQYGVQYHPDRRPVGPFASYKAAEDYLKDNPPRPPQDPNPTIVERIILTGDWYPAEKDATR
jgi:hypothetical protein